MEKLIGMYVFLFAVIGFISCGTSGEDAEVSEEGEVAEASAEAETYSIDTDESVINWKGNKPTKTHEGTVMLQGGELKVEDGKITSGNFTIDMSTITDTDLEGESKEKLEAHLKGTVDEKRDDFFNVRKYPTAKFEVTKTTELEGDENANMMIYGNLTIKDKTHQIGFKANVDMMDNMIKANTPQFTIDRTKWGINFMSKSVMDDAKDNFIYDEIGLVIDLVAKK